MDYAEVRAAFFQPRSIDAPDGTVGGQTPARRLRDAIEPIAMIGYWSELANDAYVAEGLDFLTHYVWARACVLGEADASVVASAFGVFEPGLVASLYDAGRTACSLEGIRALREYRGDCHLAACVAAGLNGLQANLLTELRIGWAPQSYTATRGWTPEAMDAATTELRRRGLVGGSAPPASIATVHSSSETSSSSISACAWSTWAA